MVYYILQNIFCLLEFVVLPTDALHFHEPTDTLLHFNPPSPDLVWCGFYLFLKIKSVLKVLSQLMQLIRKYHEVLKQLTKADLLNAFDQWKTRLQWCVGVWMGSILKRISPRIIIHTNKAELLCSVLLSERQTLYVFA